MVGLSSVSVCFLFQKLRRKQLPINFGPDSEVKSSDSAPPSLVRQSAWYMSPFSWTTRADRGSSSYNSSCPSLNPPPNPGVLFKSCLLSANHIDTSHGGESQHPAEDQLSRKHTPFGEYLHLRVASADSKAMAAKFGDGFIIDLLPWGLWFMSSFLGEFLAMVD